MFVDRQELEPGAAWQLRIFDSLERSRRVVAVRAVLVLHLDQQHGSALVDLVRAHQVVVVAGEPAVSVTVRLLNATPPTTEIDSDARSPANVYPRPPISGLTCTRVSVSRSTSSTYGESSGMVINTDSSALLASSILPSASRAVSRA